MASKLRAARMVTSAGEAVIIASGRDPQVLTRILSGEAIGTLIQPQGKSISPKKRWIGFSAQKPRGRIILDAGACSAVVEKRRSLLAIGITAIEGDFDKGGVVAIVSPDGKELARGLTNYSASELVKIKGVKSDRILGILGHCPYEEVIHCDNLVIVQGRAES
jgi:glutamate 5-kinase